MFPQQGILNRPPEHLTVAAYSLVPGLTAEQCRVFSMAA